MKKTAVLLLAALLFAAAGCASLETPAPETISDEIVPASYYLEDAYEITIGVPADAVLSCASQFGDKKEYIQQAGDYRIVTQVLLASDVQSAVRQLSGCDLDQLDVIRTERFSLPEYRFAWYSMERGLCRADVVQDGERFYAVTFAVDEDSAKTYNELAAKTFSTFGLHTDEQV